MAQKDGPKRRSLIPNLIHQVRWKAWKPWRENHAQGVTREDGPHVILIGAGKMGKWENGKMGKWENGAPLHAVEAQAASRAQASSVYLEGRSKIKHQTSTIKATGQTPQVYHRLINSLEVEMSINNSRHLLQTSRLRYRSTQSRTKTT